VEAVEGILRSYAWNLRYAEALVADLPEGHWTRPGGPGLPNHPAWTLGHLCTGSALVAEDLGAPPALPPGWRDLFQRRGPGDPRRPDPDPAAYPPGGDLLAELRRLHAVVADAVRAAPPARFDAPEEWRFAGDLPTAGDGLLFMLVTHEALHLGQLEAWRRAAGLPAALAAL